MLPATTRHAGATIAFLKSDRPDGSGPDESYRHYGGPAFGVSKPAFGVSKVSALPAQAAG
jgi:hypothetical protein